MSKIINNHEMDLSNSKSRSSQVTGICTVYVKRSINKLSALKELKNFKELDLSNTEVIDISSLEGTKNLEYLDIRKTKVKDISVLDELQKLKTLKTKGSKVSKRSLKELKRIDQIDVE